MKHFYVGQQVRCNDKDFRSIGFTKGYIYNVTRVTPFHNGAHVYAVDDTGIENYLHSDWFDPVEDAVSIIGVLPSIADDLRLTPQARKILRHLKAGKPITPLKAQNVYGCYRLAARIHEIRAIGYKVKCENKRDEGGHHYGRYQLAA